MGIPPAAERQQKVPTEDSQSHCAERYPYPAPPGPARVLRARMGEGIARREDAAVRGSAQYADSTPIGNTSVFVKCCGLAAARWLAVAVVVARRCCGAAAAAGYARRMRARIGPWPHAGPLLLARLAAGPVLSCPLLLSLSGYEGEGWGSRALVPLERAPCPARRMPARAPEGMPRYAPLAGPCSRARACSACCPGAVQRTAYACRLAESVGFSERSYAIRERFAAIPLFYA